MSQLALILSICSIGFSLISLYLMYLTEKVRKENDAACEAWRSRNNGGERT